MEKATIEYKKDVAGMGMLRFEVVRDGDREVLGAIGYNPDSPASCEEMELELASICGRYDVEIVQ